MVTYTPEKNIRRMILWLRIKEKLWLKLVRGKSLHEKPTLIKRLTCY